MRLEMPKATEDHKIERHLLGWICVAITLLGICLIIISSEVQMPVIRDIGSTLCSIGIIGFIFQYYFYSSLESRIEQTMRRLEEVVKPKLAIDAEKLGIKNILHGRYEFDEIRLSLYDKATNVSWLTHDGPAIPRYDLVQEILKRVKKGTNFRFLASANAPEIEDTVQRLMEIKEKSKGRDGKVEIKFYEEDSKWYIQIIDDLIYAQPYLHDVGIGKTPMVEVESGKDIYEYFERHFAVVWKNSKDIEQFAKEKSKVVVAVKD